MIRYLVLQTSLTITISHTLVNDLIWRKKGFWKKKFQTDDEPFDINSYLLPFAIVVGICFLIMLGIVIFKVRAFKHDLITLENKMH